MHFKGRKGDQIQVGGVRVQTRNEIRGSRSSIRGDGGAVARTLKLVS